MFSVKLNKASAHNIGTQHNLLGELNSTQHNFLDHESNTAQLARSQV